MKKIFSIISIVAATLAVLSSCGSVKIVKIGSTNEYKYMRPAQQARVKTVETLDSVKADGSVYRVTPEQLKQYVKGRELAVVWNFEGTGNTEPNAVAQQCEEAGVELVLVSNLYRYLFMRIMAYPLPVFAIDNETMGIEERKKYVPAFYEELTNDAAAPKAWEKGKGAYVCFRRGTYVGQCKKLSEAFEILKAQ